VFVEIFNTFKTKKLVKILSDNKKTQSDRYEAAVSLGKIGQQAIDLLEPKLNDKDKNVRIWVICALHQIGDEAVDYIIKALSDNEMEVRDYASKALGEIGQPAVESLLEAVRDKNSNVRRGAAIALGSINSDEAVDDLIGLLNDEEWFVCERAAQALGKMRCKKAIEPLIKLLKNDSEGVQLYAANALIDIGIEILPPLIQTYENAKYNIKELICRIITIQDSFEYLSADELLIIVKASRPDINGTLELACKAVIKLSEIPHFEAREILREIIMQKGAPVLYWQAAEALGIMGDEKVL